MSDQMSEVTVSIDGRDVTVAAGTTIHKACETAGIDNPTLCWAENLTPAAVCRVCVVEVEGNRALVPSCARAVEQDMVIHTDSERVRHSRKMVLEFLASGVELDQAKELARWVDEYGVDPDRYDQTGLPAATISEPIRIQDDLYIRDYDRCVLCYKCVDACGDEAQHTFAIAVAGRGFDSHISTEYDTNLPDSACVYCGNCIGVCPTGAIQFKTEFDMRQADRWHPEEQTVTRTVCSYCGVGCNLDIHTQDDRIVKVTSPSDHSVTHGHLCIKGRFGWTYVQGPDQWGR